MLQKIRELLGSDPTEPPTPADVQEAIQETEQELLRARDEVEELEAGRGDVLLYGSDAEAEEHDRKLAETRREIDRLEAARDRLGDKLTEARRAEERAELEALVDEALSGTEEYADLLDELAELHEEIVPRIKRLREIEQLVDRARREAEGTELYDDLRDPNGELRGPNRSIHEVAVIPPVSEGGASWSPEGSHRIPFKKRREEYTGPVHDLDEKEPGAYDEEGNRAEATGRAKIRRRGGRE